LAGFHLPGVRRRPFPAGLMVEFTAEALAATILADKREMLGSAPVFTSHPELRARIAESFPGGSPTGGLNREILIEDLAGHPA